MSDDKLLERADAQLVQCGIHDFGIPGACHCPAGDPRTVIEDMIKEIKGLRANLKQIGDENCGCLGSLGWAD